MEKLTYYIVKTTQEKQTIETKIEGWDYSISFNDLCIDAVDVFRNTQTPPSELLRQNREMREALDEIVKSCDELGHYSIQAIAEYCLTSLNKDKE